ncbi:hypothetical protein ACPV5L_02405 [Vibrio astriarenae]
MFSQTLKAQLIRMTLLLVVVLVGVHHSPYLLEVLAQQAMDAGCHTHESMDSHDSHHHHNHNHNH